jgi:hypothetical protein
LQEGTEQMLNKEFGDGKDIQKSSGLVLRLSKQANL